MHLNPGTLLQGGKYRIVRFIKSGGFGCTYEAVHSIFCSRVAIKEFFPKDFCNRDSNTRNVTVGTLSKHTLVSKLKRKFIDEAIVLHSLSHPGIVKVTDVFEENGTAYYVMDYIEGSSLEDLVTRDGAMSESQALRYVDDVCLALSYVHSRNRLHLDLKPGNIMVCQDGRAVLIDFGASKQYDEENGENTSSLLGMTPGYAPLEQYNRTGLSHFSAATDIYALGATLYKLVTGQTPPDASDVNENGLPDFPLTISSSVRAAVEAAMSPRRKDRPQSIEDFRSLFEANMTSEPYLNEGVERNPLEKKMIADGTEDTVYVSAADTIKSDGSASYKDGILRIKGVEYPMVNVRGGEFMMGNGGVIFSNRSHKVCLKGFMIGCFQVTQDLWEAVMGRNPSHFKGERKPVENVSWNDCQTFLRKLNELTRQGFRLPTEAEWEFAARGGNRSLDYKYSGSDSIDDVAWYIGNSGDTTHDVGTKSPNELGLYDMSGNVYEWCSDWHGSYGNRMQTNPKGPDSGFSRVCRGGSWAHYATYCRVSDRGSDDPSRHDIVLGLRLCL